MAPRRCVMPPTGDMVKTTRSTRYVLVAQYDGHAPKVVQGSSDFTKLRKALDRRLAKPYTYTMTHARPDYAIFDLSVADRDGTTLVLAWSKGDRRA